MVIWYLIERAFAIVLGPMVANGSLSLISAVSKSPMIRWGSCCRFTVTLEACLWHDGDDLVVGRPHAVKLQLTRRTGGAPINNGRHAFGVTRPAPVIVPFAVLLRLS
jgi:hypothetical protein